MPPQVHLCGESGTGKTMLSSALRRSAIGAALKLWRSKAADRPELSDERTRGIVVK